MKAMQGGGLSPPNRRERANSVERGGNLQNHASGGSVDLPKLQLLWQAVGANNNISGYAKSEELFAFLGITSAKTTLLKTIAGLDNKRSSFAYSSPSSSSSAAAAAATTTISSSISGAGVTSRPFIPPPSFSASSSSTTNAHQNSTSTPTPTPSSSITPGVYLNNQPLNPSSPPSRFSFLEANQVKNLYGNLTVLETLVFSAELRVEAPSHPSELFVLRLLTEMGLKDIADTRVSALSTWQQRMVLFATEAVANRDAIFFDMPTGDLDAPSALALVTALQRAARGGRLVAITMSSLTFREYAILDRIQLLSPNGAIFFGSGSSAVSYFAQLGRTPSPGASISDFLLDLVDDDLSSGGYMDAHLSFLEKQAEANSLFAHNAQGILVQQHLLPSNEQQQQYQQPGGKSYQQYANTSSINNYNNSSSSSSSSSRNSNASADDFPTRQSRTTFSSPKQTSSSSISPTSTSSSSSSSSAAASEAQREPSSSRKGSNSEETSYLTNSNTSNAAIVGNNDVYSNSNGIGSWGGLGNSGNTDNTAYMPISSNDDDIEMLSSGHGRLEKRGGVEEKQEAYLRLTSYQNQHSHSSAPPSPLANGTGTRWNRMQLYLENKMGEAVELFNWLANFECFETEDENCSSCQPLYMKQFNLCLWRALLVRRRNESQIMAIWTLSGVLVSCGLLFSFGGMKTTLVAVEDKCTFLTVLPFALVLIGNMWNETDQVCLIICVFMCVVYIYSPYVYFCVYLHFPSYHLSSLSPLCSTCRF